MSNGIQAPQLSEVLGEVKDIFFGGWRYRWPAISVMWVCCVIGWLVVLSMPNIYEASSRMFIDTESSLDPLLQGLAVDTNQIDEAMVQVRSLTSRPSMERIATIAGIVPVDSTPAQLQGIVQKLQEDVTLTLDTNQVLSVMYENSDKGAALSVVSQLMDGFVEGLLRVNRTDTDSAQEFLETKLAEYGDLLIEAENNLAEFKRQNIGRMPGAGQDYFTRLQEEENRLAQLQLAYQLAQDRRSELLRQIEGESPVFGILSASGADQPTSRKALEYEAELQRLRIQYTDSHPEIVRIKGIIAEMNEKDALESSSGVGGGGEPSLDENPVYQNMKIQLSAAELELSDLKIQRETQRRLVEDLRNKVDIIPDVEANLKKLNRDYDVNKAQYDALLQRLELSRLTEAAEAQSNIDFRVIDPPIVTPFPVGPERPLFMTIVLIISIAAGLGLALVLSFIRPVFYSPRGLERHFNVPVLGGVEYVSSAEDSAQRKKSSIMTAAYFGGIIVIYILMITFNQTGANFISSLMQSGGAFT